MTEQTKPARPAQWRQTILTLGALALGIMLGMVAASQGKAAADYWATLAQPIGTIWLNALRMTIIPLIVALLVTGILQAAEAARAGRLTRRALMWFGALLLSSSVFAALMTPLLLSLFPMPSAAGAALKQALSSGTEAIGEVPTIGQFLTSIIPTNPVAAAANDAILPLIIFTTVFAFAVTRLGQEERTTLARFFGAITSAMIIMINWVLALAPIGVFALAVVVGAQAGTAALGALAHYVAILSALGILIWALAYPVAVLAGRKRLRDYARAVLPAQAVAISTQSSLASLPAMVRGATQLGVPTTVTDIVLPLAVALFRVTGPAMNLGVAIYIAHWYGMPITPTMLAAGVFAATLTTIGAVSLPGQVSFVTSIAPIAIAMGVPVEPLALLIAVETIPDIFRTLGNVSMDVAVTTAVARDQDEGEMA